jgi:murein tripeptide amidase MpaA
MKRKNAGYYYTLTFSMQFDHDGDTVYLAHCYPYTFTDMSRYLNSLDADPKRKNRLRRRVLTPTIAGNNCEMIIITTFQSDPEAIKNRKGIVLSSRVHPGESGASWIMKGIIDYLTGPSLNAKILRDNFVFKIVPMLNPDGVINGSTRCNLAGVDLNRIWNDP